MRNACSAMVMFQNRREAGRRLAHSLDLLHLHDPLVLGLPRGGVVVAAEVARALQAPLDVWVVKKIGAPQNEEVGVGAVAEGGFIFLDDRLARMLHVSTASLRDAVLQKQDEVRLRTQLLRAGLPRPAVRGRTVIVVDDGVANGVTAQAAVRDLRRCGARRIVLAVPVAASAALAHLETVCDGVVCLGALGPRGSVGAHYREFAPVGDDEVAAILAAFAAPPATSFTTT